MAHVKTVVFSSPSAYPWHPIDMALSENMVPQNPIVHHHFSLLNSKLWGKPKIPTHLLT